MLKRALRVLLLLPLLLAVAVLLLPSLLPVDAWKPSLQARVKEATGRELRIGGAMRVSLLPRLEIEAADVGLSNAPGATAAEMVTLKELHLELQVLPLFSGRIVVDRFVLVGPVVSLEVSADGKANWQLEAATSPGAPSAPSTGTAPSAPASPLELRLEDVRLEDGAVRWVDRRKGGGSTEFGGVGVTIAMTTLDDPFHIQGAFTWNARPVTLDATVADPRALMAQRESGVRARIETGGGHVGWDGGLTLAAEVRASGSVDLDVPSIRDLSAWLGQPIDAPKGTFGLLKIAGSAALEPGQVSFTNASVTLDALQTSGSVAVAWKGPRPRITADLAVKTLDLRPLLPDASATPAAAGQAMPTGPGGWSLQPFSPGLLRSVDASFRFSVDALLTPHLRIGKGSLTAGLDNGRLDVAIGGIELYGGSGKGAVRLQATGADSVALDTDLHLVDVQLEPLLKDTFGGNWLSGRSRMDLTLAGSGRNQQELVSSLAGKGAVDVQDGSIRGINLAAMVVNVASAFQKKGDGERTEFRQVRGTFRMNGGVLQNSDLVFQSDLLQAEGQGSVDFGRARVDYRVTPKVVAPVVGQLTGGIVGMKVPVLVRGPWSDVSFAPDLVGLLKEGVQAPGTILKDAADFTKGLFGR